MIHWDWKESVSNWDLQKIHDDIIKHDGLIYEMSKEDCVKILRKTNYDFIFHLDFDQLYSMAVRITIRQIKKKDNFLASDSNAQMLRILISRVCNNLKNLFDSRYKESIVAYNDYHDELEDAGALNFDDALSILLLEEEIQLYEAEMLRIDKQYMEDLKEYFNIDENNQAFFDFQNQL